MKRKSSSRVNQVIVSYSLFSVFANPVRYVWAASLASFALGAIFFVNAVVLYALRMVSAYTALLSMALFIVAIVLFVLGVVVKQGNMIQRELWTIQRFHLALEKARKPEAEEEKPLMEARASGARG